MMNISKSILLVSLFALSFAFVESSVVVYLRSIYYPGGFSFPLRPMSSYHLTVELAREAATIIMLISVGALAGVQLRQKFGFFLIAFGVWDIFYYVWLWVVVHWPASILDWDILFLIPVPWIGPVIAPVAVSLFMILGGLTLVYQTDDSRTRLRPRVCLALFLAGSTLVLASFLYDPDAAFHFQSPKPYHYELFAVGMILYGASLVGLQKPRSKT